MYLEPLVCLSLHLRPSLNRFAMFIRISKSTKEEQYCQQLGYFLNCDNYSFESKNHLIFHEPHLTSNWPLSSRDRSLWEQSQWGHDPSGDIKQHKIFGNFIVWDDGSLVAQLCCICRFLSMCHTSPLVCKKEWVFFSAATVAETKKCSWL